MEQRTEERQATEEEIAAAIAAVLAGAVVLPPGVAPVGAIAFLLRGLPGAPDASVSRAVARLVAGDLPSLPGRTGVLRRAYVDNLLYRAYYALTALRRVTGALGEGEELRDALSKEAAYFEAHKAASKQRERGARLNDAAAERFGPLLSWVHLGTAKTHRPSHLSAHGKNYLVDRPPESTDGALPAMAPHCDCIAGPPIPGAELLR